MKNLTLCILISFLYLMSPIILFTQENDGKAEHSADLNFKVTDEPMISGGAEFNRMLQQAMRNGNIDDFKFGGSINPTVSGSPRAITTFSGSDFDDNGTYNSGFRFIPPDPIGVAGTDRVIAVMNTLIECRDKSGTLLWIDDLAGFFSPLTPATFTFDPKVIYDQYENRFLVVDLEVVETGSNPDPVNTSFIFLAVSKTATPATPTSADWYYHAINAKEVIGGYDHWADYPGFAIDEEVVYITANMFAHLNGTTTFSVRLWIVDKGVVGGFYAGGAASVTKYDPYAGGGGPYTTQPAHVFGAGGAEVNVGTYLVSYSGLSSGGIEAVQVVRVDDPLTTPVFTNAFVIVGDIDNTTVNPLTDAPQNGPVMEIEVNDRRALHCVWRDDNLWFTTTIAPSSPPDSAETTAHWFKLGITVWPPTLLDQGNIGGEEIADATFTFFPSIAVNSLGDAIIGFSASAYTIFPGSYYAGRFAGDPPGTVNPAVTIQAGLDYYQRTDGANKNRWGDYSVTSVDPTDDQTFWVFNEYAMARGTGSPPEDGRWATVFAKVPRGDLPVELTSFTASVTNRSVKLDWQTATEVDNYGFEIERTTPLSSPHEGGTSKVSGVWEMLGFVQGHGNSYSPKLYSFEDTNPFGADKFVYRLKQIDNDGAYEYFNAIEVEITPEEFALYQNYPNPFNPSTTIRFSLPKDNFVSLNLFNTLGEKVLEIAKDNFAAGTHEVEFNITNKVNKLANGVYFYSIKAGNFTDTKKLLLLK